MKLLPNKSWDKYKSRAVAKGYDQTKGIDYNETFSLVMKLVTIRIVVTITFTENWLVRQLDVNNTFLNRDLEKKVYMT